MGWVAAEKPSFAWVSAPGASRRAWRNGSAAWSASLRAGTPLSGRDRAEADGGSGDELRTQSRRWDTGVKCHGVFEPGCLRGLHGFC